MGSLTRRTATLVAGLALALAPALLVGSAAQAQVPPLLLQEGDRGAAVADWQATINAWASTDARATTPPLAVDAIFGPRTDSATRDFQRAHRLRVDGIVGPATRDAVLDEAPGPVALNESSVLGRGSMGSEVSAWQHALNAWLAHEGSDDRIVEDGIFGFRTDAMTRRFQLARAIAVDGIVGPATRAEMDATTPAVAPTPAPGVCATAAGSVVHLTVLPDLADPRCAVASLDQGLEVTNATASVVTVSLADARLEIAAGATRTVVARLGDALTPGVHTVAISRFGDTGPQLWIQ